ncbi:MAG: DUF1015 family protein [Chitinivibrionales bacterium]|nr:DUF1015 family protein [Chitinivibrionales bacterium]
MAEIRPFCGYRFNLDDPGNLQQFVAPPYDMIDGDMQEILYRKDPHNIIRIIQNKPEPGDQVNNDRHQRAAALLNKWITENILLKDSEPSIYVYRQRFSAGEDNDAVTYERTGIVARVRLVDFKEKIVLPHENTLSAPKVDRYELLKATHCNTGQIFGIIQDEGDFFGSVSKAVTDAPAGSFTDDNVQHTLFRIKDQQTINRLVDLASDRIILIADGHHRYETALQFAQESGEPAHQFVMMTLVSMADPGLIIRPFHRSIKKRPSVTGPAMLSKLEEYFEIKEFENSSVDEIITFTGSRDNHRMAYLDHETRKAYFLSLSPKGEKYLCDNTNGMSYQWNHLDVSIINSLVINKILGLPMDGTTLHDVIDYEKDITAAYHKTLDSPDYYGTFFLRPIEIGVVRDIVAGNERMPQKSTNFFPKFYSGLVLNKLEEA